MRRELRLRKIGRVTNRDVIEGPPKGGPSIICPHTRGPGLTQLFLSLGILQLWFYNGTIIEPFEGNLMTVNLSIKKVPDELAERLRERARRNHRSIQGELMSILQYTLAPRNLTVEEARRMVKELGLKTRDESTAIIRELRDVR